MTNPIFKNDFANLYYCPYNTRVHRHVDVAKWCKEYCGWHYHKFGYAVFEKARRLYNV